MSPRKKKTEETLSLSELVKKLVASPDQALQKLTSTTSEIRVALGAELKKYLDKIDPTKEIEKIIDNYDFEVNAKISLSKKKKKKSASKTKK